VSAKRHKHTFSAFYWHFGKYGPSNVHVHPCMDDDCDRILIGRDRECNRLMVSHIRVTLTENTPLTKLTLGPLGRDEALALGLSGWDLRCNRCGSYGAEWLPRERPGWGSLAACPTHAAEIREEHERHDSTMRELRKINFHQDPPPSPRFVYE